jgi:hypothetical protein
MNEKDNLMMINGIVFKECFPVIKEKFLGLKLTNRVIEQIKQEIMAILWPHEKSGEITLDDVDFLFVQDKGTLAIKAIDHTDTIALEENDGLKN